MITTPNKKLVIPESMDPADIVAALKSNMEKLDNYENPANQSYTNVDAAGVTDVKGALDWLVFQVKALVTNITNSIKAVRDELAAGTLKPKNASYADSAGNANAVAWDKVSGKPTTFAPATHSHAWSTITGKPTSFAPSAHKHAWGDLTGVPGTFTPAAHNQSATTITAGALPVGVTATNGTDYGTSRLRNIYAGTGDMTPNVTGLANGAIYLCYEN